MVHHSPALLLASPRSLSLVLVSAPSARYSLSSLMLKNKWRDPVAIRARWAWPSTPRASPSSTNADIAQVQLQWLQEDQNRLRQQQMLSSGVAGVASRSG